MTLEAQQAKRSGPAAGGDDAAAAASRRVAGLGESDPRVRQLEQLRTALSASPHVRQLKAAALGLNNASRPLGRAPVGATGRRPSAARSGANPGIPGGPEPIQLTKWVYLSEEDGLVDTNDPARKRAERPRGLEVGDTWDDSSQEITKASDRMAAIFTGNSNKAPALNLPSSEDFGDALRAPPEARKAMLAFASGGLLIKTLQHNKAHLDFQDAGAPPQALSGTKEGRYGPKRNWSLIHRKLIAAPYLMRTTPDEQEEVRKLHSAASGSGLAAHISSKRLGAIRSMAALADPALIGDDRFLGIHEGDASSSATLASDTRTLAPHVAKSGLASLQRRLLEKQAQAAGRIDNSEIQTVGFSPGAIIGFAFQPGVYSTWAEAKPHFQEVVDLITSPQPELPGFTHSPRRSFLVFTFHVDMAAKKTRLVYLDTLTPRA